MTFEHSAYPQPQPSTTALCVFGIDRALPRIDVRLGRSQPGEGDLPVSPLDNVDQADAVNYRLYGLKLVTSEVVRRDYNWMRTTSTFSPAQRHAQLTGYP